MKKNSILALGLLALAVSVSSFAVGGGLSLLKGNEAVAVKAEDAAEDIVLTFPDENKAKNGKNNYTSTWTARTGEQEFTIKNFNNNNWSSNWTYIKCGNKSAASVATIETANAISYAIESVEVTIDSITAKSVNDIYLQTSSDGSAWTDKISLDTKSSGTKAFAISSPAENLYYKLSFDCQKNSTNGIVQVSKVALKALQTEPYIGVENGSSIELAPEESASYALSTRNLTEGATLEVVAEDSSVAEVTLSEDKSQLNISAKSIGSTKYTVTAKDADGTTVLASFSGTVTVAVEPTKISFGSASGSWNFNDASSTFTDSDDVKWTGTVTGTSSFTTNAGYSQIGSSDNPAKSISAEAALGDFYSIDSISGVFGGYSNTAGSIALKAGSIVVGTGALNASSNVTVSSTSSAIGNSLSFEITGISKGVKLISLEYTVSAIPESLFTEVDAFVATYITPYSGEAKEGETCKSKYENASDAYNKLSEKGQQLFDIHTNYAGAKAIFDYWYSATSTDAKGTPLAAAKASEIASVSSIGLFAVGGVVVLGLFFVNKKKAE